MLGVTIWKEVFTDLHYVDDVSMLAQVEEVLLLLLMQEVKARKVKASGLEIIMEHNETKIQGKIFSRTAHT